ncbi:hypothetical protein OTK51_19735 [Vibrio scophthalmi]|uniref:hypothetical protein n=1 Tax=Vibrio TaxID=662 RepID=UPI0003116EC1|nr:MULTISPECIES: hypothetical protein [Vibrio]MCY9805662.1 hypothetical protein [Vibrio scophthalmi]
MEEVRIGNMPKTKLVNLYHSMETDELDILLIKSSGQEINRLLSHLSERQLNELFASQSQQAINAVFERIPQNRINKYLLLASEANIRKIVISLSNDAKFKVLSGSSSSLRTKLLSTLPAKAREEWKHLINEESLLNRELSLITTNRIDNSLEKEAIDRIRSLEHQVQLRQEQAEARLQQSDLKLSMVQQQIAQSEKQLHDQQIRAQKEHDILKKRENDLSNRLLKLRDEHEKQIQNRIDIKVPEYVANAISALETKENEYKTKAKDWSDKGNIALACAVAAALLALGYGAYEFSNTPKADISWLFFGYLMLKGLIVIGLFGAWAKHAYNQSNAYMHEALKRTERTHAISFGKLYLEIYGNDVSKEDMKSIFENWNMESQSAFKDIKQVDFQPQTLDKLKDIIGLMKSGDSGNVTAK